MNSPSLVTYSAPNIPRTGPAALASRRSYLFRASVARRPAGESLSIDLLRSLWRVASARARNS